MEKIVGIKHLTGTFNDKPYDKYHIYVVNDVDNENVIGTCPNVYKVKAAMINSICSPDQIERLIGMNCEVYFDAYKNVAQFNLV